MRRKEESVIERLKKKYSLQKAARIIRRTLTPEGSGEFSAHSEVARALYERDSLSSLLTYRDFNDEKKMYFVEEEDDIAACFTILYTPVMLAGVDMENQLEALINTCPADTVIQCGVLSSKLIEPRLYLWHKARTEKCDNIFLKKMADNRRDYIRDGIRKKSLLEIEEYHPRHFYYMLTVRVPYGGDIADEEGLQVWIKEITNLQTAILGNLQGCGLYGELCDRDMTLMLIREVLNNHKDPSLLRNSQRNDTLFEAETVARGTRLYPEENGTLTIQSHDNDPDKLAISVMTVDGFPRENYLPNMMNLLGDPKNGTSRINSPFYAYTTIHIVNHEKAESSLTNKLGALNKQLMGESQWLLSMMRHLYTRRDDVSNVLLMSRSGHRMVRVMMGINLYSEPKYAVQESERLRSMWSENGFRVSRETFISPAIFLTTLPGQYNPALDPPGRGLQRLETMLSNNAATLMWVQGDWQGTHPKHGGKLLLSRRGQLACVDTFQSKTGYNYITIATTGAGKSFDSCDQVGDVLSKGGIVRLVDNGGSYKRLCNLFDGTYLEFDLGNPLSMNPFWGLTHNQKRGVLDDGSPDRGEFNETVPMLKSMVIQMAFPIGRQSDYDVQLVEKAITDGWKRHGHIMELKHVYEELKILSSDKELDPRSRGVEIALQLEPFAIGRHGQWFNGEPKLDLQGNFVVLDMINLNDDPELRTVILSLLMSRIARDMYSKPKGIPGSLIVDEAWALLGNKNEGNGMSGNVIESVFRQIRKFGGQGAIISQSYKDAERSDAAQAAFSNAAWKFTLKQRGDSLPYARKKDLIPDSDYLYGLMTTLKRLDGYSEQFVDGSEVGMGLYRLCVDPYSYYVFTTDPKEVSIMDEKRKENGWTEEQSIEYMAKNFPPGSLS